MRYVGQQTEVTVALAGDPHEKANRVNLRGRFDRAYEILYGVRLDDMDVEVVSWRVTARGGDTHREVRANLADAEAAPKSTRSVFLDDQSLRTPVFDRLSLAPGQRIPGPVIVEERETTVFVLPGWDLAVDPDGNLIATRRA
jgi:N-methylhydantoinase A